jgi:hypothetical protein
MGSLDDRYRVCIETDHGSDIRKSSDSIHAEPSILSACRIQEFDPKTHEGSPSFAKHKMDDLRHIDSGNDDASNPSQVVLEHLHWNIFTEKRCATR